MSANSAQADPALAALLGSELLLEEPRSLEPMVSLVVDADEPPPEMACAAAAGGQSGGNVRRVALSDALPSLGSAAFVAVCFSAGPKCGSCQDFYPKLGKLLRSGALQAASLAPVLVLAGRNYRDLPDDQYDQEAAKEAVHLQLPALPRSATSRASLPLLVQSFGVVTNPHVLVLDRATGKVLAGGRDMRPELVAMHQAQQQQHQQQPQGATDLEIALAAWRSALAATFSADASNPEPAPGPADVPAQPTLRHRLGLGGSKPHLFASGHRIHPTSKRLYVDEEAVRIRAGLLHLTTWIMFLHLNFQVFGDNFRIVDYAYPFVAWDMLGGAFVGLTPFTLYGVLAALIAHVLRRPLVWKPQTPKRFAWMIGFTMATVCFVTSRGSLSGWDTQVTGALINAVLIMCMLASWLEACAGWCAGCFAWNHLLVPLASMLRGSQNVQACEECKV